MRFAVFVSCLVWGLVGILVMGCANGPTPTFAPIEDATVLPNSTAAATAIRVPPQSGWKLAQNPTATNGESSLAVHLLVVEPDRATLIYSFAGVEALQAEFADNIVLKDNSATRYKPILADVIQDLGGVQIGSLTFQLPMDKVLQLKLFFEPTTNNPLEVEVAHRGEPIGSVGFPTTGETLARQGVFSQSGYRITFNGFSANGTTQNKATENTPSAAADTPDQLAQGAPFTGEATLRIETLGTDHVQFLYMVILIDGEVRFKVLE